MKNFCKNHTIIFIFIVIAIAIGNSLLIGVLQNKFAYNLMISYSIEAVCKYVVSIIPLTLMAKWGYIKRTGFQKMWKGFALGGIATIIFCIPNLLKFTLIDPVYYFVKWNVIFSILLACFAIGLMEESAMRGVVFPLLCEKWKDKPHTYLKAGLASSFLFAIIHLNGSLRYFMLNKNLSVEFFLDNLYQVYYTFCFGILAVGVTLCAKSILPMIFWHGICDISAFMIDGFLLQATLNYFYQNKTFTLQNVLNKYGILQEIPFPDVVLSGAIYFVPLLMGLILIKKAEYDDNLENLTLMIKE